MEATGAELHDLFREVFALQAALAGIMDAVHAETGLSTSKHRIVRALDREEGATAPRLATLLGVSRQFVQTVCNAMGEEGLVVFRNNPQHRRSKLIFLTDRGKRVFRESRRRENEMIARSLPRIEAEKVLTAGRVLAAIRGRLPSPDRRPGKSV